MVAASVLPSPVFISEILPSCNAMPPITWTSKGRIPRVRRDASRTTAKASGRMPSSVSPSARRPRNSSVFARSSSSESFSISGSRAVTDPTRCWRTLTLRPSPILKIFVNRLATWEHQPKDPYQYAPAPLRGTAPPNSLRHGALFCGLYETVVAVPAPVDHVDVPRFRARKDVEVVVEQVHLEHGLFGPHRLHLELLGPHYPRLQVRLLFRGDWLIGGRRRVLRLALPAVDLASPVPADLPLELVR